MQLLFFDSTFRFLSCAPKTQVNIFLIEMIQMQFTYKAFNFVATSFKACAMQQMFVVSTKQFLFYLKINKTFMWVKNRYNKFKTNMSTYDTLIWIFYIHQSTHSHSHHIGNLLDQNMDRLNFKLSVSFL